MWVIKMTCTVFSINNACYYQPTPEAMVSKQTCSAYVENYVKLKRVNISNIKYECVKIQEIE